MYFLSGVTFSLCHKLIIPKKLILREFSLLQKIRGKPILLDKTNHKVIYEFKYIIFPAGILKTKYLLPIISLPLISASFYFKQPQTALLLIVGSFFQLLLLVAAAKYTRNMIGKIYVNKKTEINDVIISSVDSDGNRIDESFCPDQLVLSKFLPEFLGFLQVKTECGNKNYILNVKSAKFHDVKAMRSVFNDTLFFINVKSFK